MPSHENAPSDYRWPRSFIGEQMSDEERVQRIGWLLRRAAVRYWAAIDAREIPPPPEYQVDPPPPANDSDHVRRLASGVVIFPRL